MISNGYLDEEEETWGYYETSQVIEGCTTTTDEYREPDTLSEYDGDEDYLNIIEEILPTPEGEESKYADIDTFKATLQEDYNEMVESVKTYGGFYVGRYETSLSADADKKAQSKYNQIPATTEEESANTWYGLYAKQKEFSTSSVQGSMIWGSQYDAMLNFAMITPDAEKVNSDAYGNYGGSVKETGTHFKTINESQVFDKICNIFDLGGNLLEWTLETHNTGSRVTRGGNCYYGGDLASGRVGLYTYDAAANNGSRLSLYIK